MTMFPATKSALFRCNFRIFGIPSLNSLIQNLEFHTGSPDFRARKGTRVRKAKAKVKKEVQLRPFLQRRLKGDPNAIYVKQRPYTRDKFPAPVDDVYFYRKFETKQWNFREAIQNHREVHDPTVYNKPNAPVILRIDIDLKYPNRPQKCQDRWRSIVEMVQPFKVEGEEPPTILAFCPDDKNLIQEVLRAGANIAGSGEIVKAIQTGELVTGDFEYVIAHPLMMPEITPLRGIMKKNFPNSKTKTISIDLINLVQRLKNGIKIGLVSNDQEPDYGYIETRIGNLDMDIEGLEGNFEAILSDTLVKRVPGKHPNDFIIQCILKTPESFEQFKINIQDLFVKLDKKPRQLQQKDADEEEQEAPEEEVISKTAVQ